MRIAELGDVDALLKLYPEAATPKTPQAAAAAKQEKKTSVMDTLLGNKLSLECQNEAGSTPLHVAALNGRKGFVDKLLDQRVNINVKDGSGNTVMGKKSGVENYTDPKAQAKFTDKEAFNAIKEGKGKMKAFKERLTDEEIKALVAHIRAFKK